MPRSKVSSSKDRQAGNTEEIHLEPDRLLTPQALLNSSQLNRGHQRLPLQAASSGLQLEGEGAESSASHHKPGVALPCGRKPSTRATEPCLGQAEHQDLLLRDNSLPPLPQHHHQGLDSRIITFNEVSGLVNSSGDG